MRDVPFARRRLGVGGVLDVALRSAAVCNGDENGSVGFGLLEMYKKSFRISGQKSTKLLSATKPI